VNSEADSTIIVLVRVDRERTAAESHPRHIHPPLDLFYIRSAVAEQLGYAPKLVDDWLIDNEAPPLLDRILMLEPGIVVIRSMSWCINEASRLSQELKKRGIITIAVGEQVTHIAEKMVARCRIHESKATRGNPLYDHWHDCWDFPVLGEPEQAVPDLLTRLCQGGEVSRLAPGYWNRLVKKHPFQVDTQQSLAPPVFSDKELNNYPFPFPVPGRIIRRWGYVISGWGCPYHCQHCTEVVRKSVGTELRLRSPSDIVDEIEQLVVQGVEGIAFEDDTLFCNRQHLLAVCSEITNRRLQIRWMANARPDELDEQRVAAAAQAGAALLKLGIESGSPEMIEKMGKSSSGERWIKQAHEGVRLLKQYKIASVGLYMVGLPGESEAQVHQTIRLSKAVNNEYVQVQRFTAYADVAMTKESSASAPRQTNLYHYASQDNTLSKIQLRRLGQLQRLFYFCFYLRPTYIFQHLKLFWRWYLTPHFFSTLPARLAFILGLGKS